MKSRWHKFDGIVHKFLKQKGELQQTCSVQALREVTESWPSPS